MYVHCNVISENDCKETFMILLSLSDVNYTLNYGLISNSWNFYLLLLLIFHYVNVFFYYHYHYFVYIAVGKRVKDGVNTPNEWSFNEILYFVDMDIENITVEVSTKLMWQTVSIEIGITIKVSYRWKRICNQSDKTAWIFGNYGPARAGPLYEIRIWEAYAFLRDECIFWHSASLGRFVPHHV